MMTFHKFAKLKSRLVSMAIRGLIVIFPIISFLLIEEGQAVSIVTCSMLTMAVGHPQVLSSSILPKYCLQILSCHSQLFKGIIDSNVLCRTLGMTRSAVAFNDWLSATSTHIYFTILCIHCELVCKLGLNHHIDSIVQATPMTLSLSDPHFLIAEIATFIVVKRTASWMGQMSKT
jgi:hypothetical protein